MKQTYERPEMEQLSVTVTNFFCTNPNTSDKGTTSYIFGGSWDSDDDDE